MSLLNVWISPQRALVCVDTAARTVQGNQLEISKMVPLVHANAVIAVRGVNLLLHSVFTSCLLFQGDVHFDSLAAWLMPALNDGFETYVKNSKAAFGVREEDLRGGEIVVAGFSRAKQEMAGLKLTRNLGDAAFTMKLIEPWTLGPCADWNTKNMPPMPDSTERMIEIARHQVRCSRSEDPAAPIGGRLLMATLMKDKVTIETIADLG